MVSLGGNLGLLGFFKYVNFGIEQINVLGNQFGITEIPFLEIVLPVGISFYTFQTISYTVDVYRGKLEPSKSLREFALFVAFFPQITAGPILRASHFLPQLREKIASSTGSVFHPKRIIITKSNLRYGITLIVLGLFKKMFFADNISPLVTQIFDQTMGTDSLSIMLGALAYGVQIYGDFSGYSDIAIGVAIILGLKIPLNFNYPYFASSPSNFWKRWHISLSTWLRDYLYVPLGGNKKSKFRTYLNLLIVMLLGGLWHGASWNFIIWGLLHGVYLAVYKIIANRLESSGNRHLLKSRALFVVSIIVTQYFVFLAWIPFRIKDTNYMLYAMQKYLIWDFETEKIIYLISINPLPVVLIIVFLLFDFIMYKKDGIVQLASKLDYRLLIIFLITSISLILYFYDGSASDYIYYRF
jgi:alginate O-acetyltransferase complex protein AlgI